MQNRNKLGITLLIAVVLIGTIMLPVSLQSQDKIVPSQEQNYYSLNNDPSHLQLSITPAPVREVPLQEQELRRQIDAARQSNDVATKERLEAQLNRLQGIVPVPMNTNSRNLPIPTSTISNSHNPPQEPDYVTYPVNTGSDPWAVSTCTNPVGFPNAGRIWVGYTAFSGSTSDTFKLAYSDNNGVTWVAYTSFNYGTSNVKFRSSELKIIPVYDGTNAYIFGVAGYTFSGNNFTAWFRYNINTSAFTYFNLTPPGNGTTYNPRIATDNSNYSSNAYVFMIASFDSLYSGTLHHVLQKYSIVENPFVATPTIMYVNTYGNGFWWDLPGAGAGVYLASDIAYYQDQGGTGNNRIMVLYNLNYGGGFSANNMYLSWVDNYASTITSNVVVSEVNSSRGGRLAFNGGTSNRNGMIVYLRLFSGADWDVAYENTINGGVTTGGWTSGYIDYTGYYASGQPDVIAIRGGANLFKAAYTEDSLGPKGFYSSWNGSSWSGTSGTNVTGNGVDTTYTRIVAGYKNGGGDDCFAAYSKVGGTGDIGIYAAVLCLTTLGIHNGNNELPKEYSLEQNYPNPFNPTTEIKFSIPNQGLVKLAVYDITGKEVATLVNEVKQAGSYSLSLNASNLASGVYFYKLESNGFSDVKKMMLIK